MRSDLTDITLVIDRSGSMASIRDDAEGGVNSLISQQAQLDGEALVTIVEFDTTYEVVVSGQPAGTTPPYNLHPRGATALLDAIGRGINETGSRLRDMPEAERPGLVLFVIVTDGKENSSREFTKARVKEMVEHQQDVYQWQFTFLGADQDAFAEAGELGLAAAGAAVYSRDKIGAAYEATNSKLARMRRMKAANQAVVNEFTDDERESMD